MLQKGLKIEPKDGFGNWGCDWTKLPLEIWYIRPQTKKHHRGCDFNLSQLNKSEEDGVSGS